MQRLPGLELKLQTSTQMRRREQRFVPWCQNRRMGKWQIQLANHQQNMSVKAGLAIFLSVAMR